MEKVPIKVDFTMYGKEPGLYVATSRQTGAVKLVIFSAYHGEYMFRAKQIQRGAIQDLLWNVACEVAGVHIRNPTYFLFRIRRNRGNCPDDERCRRGQISNLEILINLKAEIKNGLRTSISRLEVEDLFFDLLAVQPQLATEMDEAEAKGFSVLSPLTKFYYDSGEAGRAKKRAEKHRIAFPDEDPDAYQPNAKRSKRPAVLKNSINNGGFYTKKTENWKRSEAGNRAAAGQKKGQETTGARMNLKYEAFINSNQVRRLEARRKIPGALTEKEKLALPRLKKVKEHFANEAGHQNRSQLSNWLGNYAVWYDSVKYPGGVRYLPEHGPDPYHTAGIDHPAITILDVSIANKEVKTRLAGPLTVPNIPKPTDEPATKEPPRQTGTIMNWAKTATNNHS
ncbi:uncharacterized protein AUP68_04991 [Ilyonectria robusta]